MEGSVEPIHDSPEAGATSNILTRTRSIRELPWDGGDRRSDLDQPLPNIDGSVDFIPTPTDFRAGDLVEFREDGERLSLLAICLGHHNGCYHFYLNTGEWAPMLKMKTKFVIRHFVDEKTVEPLLEKLPKERLPIETLRAMSKMKLGPDRVSGAELLRRMNRFQYDSDRVLQQYSPRLENAHELVAEADKKYATLSEIHELVIASAEKYKPVVPTPAHELYAMHRTIIGDDIGFRPLDALSNDNQKWLFEITPSEDVALVQNMQTLVRLLTDVPAKANEPLSSLTPSQLGQSQLGRFILKVREAIDESRQFRDWTPHGMLGPSKQARRQLRSDWTNVDMSIMHFMLLWSGYDQFSPSSRFHWIGSMILRATGKYKESEYLSATTGWTFLQEIGYITPWDIHARFSTRPPDVKVSHERGYARLPLGTRGVKPYLTKDVFDGRRHDWAGLKAFAIDSKSTVDIDDAVSIETTDSPAEHWVHIHVADPASRIRRQCALAERSSLTPLTLYLPGHESNMWGVGDELTKLFSLAPDRLCLTFSGKVNEKGELLDYKITPAKLQEFVYLTPEDANAAVGLEKTNSSPSWSAVESFKVGESAAEPAAGREMTSPAELRAEDLKSLKSLYKVGQAIHERRLANGAMPCFPPRPTAKVSFDSTSSERAPPGLMLCNGDPSITLSWDTEESLMVSNTMQLAGEIAARWCADRNIPIPYLTQQRAEENFELLKAFAESTYYPAIRRGDTPDRETFAQFRNLLGPDERSTKPGRHFLMGLESYAKVTSPLRRYSDLVAHWQIEAALAYEMETGKPANANVLPFSAKELEKEVLPWMGLRERAILQLSRWAGARSYVMQAMFRAWKYPDSASSSSSRLPETFRLRIESPTVQGGSNARRKVLSGRLDWFDIDAWMLPEGLGRLGVSIADIRTGDVFEVKLEDINVHLGEVFVEVIGKVEMQAEKKAEA